MKRGVERNFGSTQRPNYSECYCTAPSVVLYRPCNLNRRYHGDCREFQRRVHKAIQGEHSRDGLNELEDADDANNAENLPIYYGTMRQKMQNKIQSVSRAGELIENFPRN